MATLFTRSWTAANGTSWSAVGFSRVVGSALDALVGSNKGECGASAGERVWQVTAYPQTPGHKVAVDLDWSDAAGMGRAPGVGVRWSNGGADGYMAELDSNTGAARCRIRRRRAGAWTDLTGWTDISGVVSSAALNAAVTVELRCVNEDGQVALSFRVSGTERLAYDDTSADRIEAAGSPALLIDANSTGTQVTYDSLTVTDLEGEYGGTPADLDVGVALVVDGVSYSWDDLEDAGIWVGGGRQSYDQGDGWEFTSPALMDAADAVLYPGAVVTVALDGVVVAFGRIQASSRKLQPGEGRAYRLVPSRTLAADVVLEHPEDHGNSITWNLPTDHADYDAAYAGVTIGEAIAAILDAHADGPTGLRAHLAAPPDEDTAPYVQAELDLLTLVVPAMTVSGDPVTAVEQLLAFTKYLLVIDPATLIWRLKDRTAGTIIQVDLDASHVLGDYRIDPDRNVTACVLYGSKPETTETTLSSDALDGLEPEWPAALEATHSASKQTKNTDTGLVASIGGSAPAPTMTPDTVGPPAFAMEALEWVLCTVTFVTGPEAGNSYPVTTNTALAFTLVGPWVAGGPAAGNEFVVRGNAAGGGRDNAHSEMGRRWKLTSLDQGIPEDACVHVRLTQGNIEKITAAKIVPKTDPASPTEILLDIPSIGWVTWTSGANPEPCESGGAVDSARVEVTLPTYSRSDPRVPRLWFPRSAGGDDAYRGSAYTTDPAKWNGVGTPGRGDPGVMRAMPHNAPEYTGSAAEATEWDAVFAEMLAFMGTLARSVTVTVHGVLDTQAAGLGKRLQVLGGPTELETLTDLTILAVEWDPKANTTTYYAGTFAAGPYDVQRMREASVLVNVKRRQRRETGLLEKLRDCLSGNQHSAGYARDLPPLQICGEQVGTAKTAAGRSASEDIDILWLLIQELWAWLAEQKGTEGGSDPDGTVWINKNGQWFYTGDGGGTWHEQAANNGPASSGGSGAAPGDPIRPNPKPTKPDDLGEGSIEGIMWEAIQGILANLGKTIDLETGRVIAPGTVNNGANNPDGHPWITFGPSVTPGGPPVRTPVGGGGVVPPANETPKKVMQNLLKTQVPDGDIPDPGDVVPDGANFYGPLGVVPIPVGDYAPASLLTHMFGSKRLKGLAVHDAGDAGGIVFEHPSGSLFRVEAVGYATTPMVKQVEAVAAGTGQNDGDYDTPASNVETLAPSERIDFTEAEGDGIDPEVADDGQGLMLRDAATSSIIAGPVLLPSGSKGYADGSMQVVVTVRGDQAGDGLGNYLVRLYGTLHEDGASSGAEFPIGSDFVVANPGNGGESTTVEGRLDALAGGPHDPGMRLSVRVERVGADGLDTATDRLDVYAVHADVPVQSATIGSEDYA